MVTFDYNAAAELFPPRLRKSPHRQFGYRRFAMAADAVRFAIEELPPELLSGAVLEVDGERYVSPAGGGLDDHTHPQQPRCLPSSIRAEGRRSNIAGGRISGDDRRAVDRGAVVSGLSSRLDRYLRAGQFPNSSSVEMVTIDPRERALAI
jgi:hypothetical protein